MTESTERRVAMVVMAHPDDAEFGCAGTVAAWVREGWEVYYVVCTDATGGGHDEAEVVSQEGRAHTNATRKAEQRAACKVLGVTDVIFLDKPDGVLQPTIELRRDLVRLFRSYKPLRLICQSPERSWKPAYIIGRYHPDHLAAGTAAIAAMYPASQNGWDFPELLAEGLKPHKIRELFVMAAPEINHAVDISDTLDQKIEALRCHVSQLGTNFDQLEGRMREFAARNGEAHSMAAAELFHRAEN